MDRVKIGMHVNIKRSDGRVHSAIITELKPDKNAVMVEWSEKDETKAKEIDIASLLKANPALANPAPVQSVAADLPIREALAPKGFSNLDVDDDEHETTLYDYKPPARYTRAETRVSQVAPKPSRRSIVAPASVVPGKLVAPTRKKTLQPLVEASERVPLKEIDPGNPNYKLLCMIQDFQTTLNYRPLEMNDLVTSERIMVCIRKRPMSRKEIAKKEVEIITIPTRDQLILHMPQTKVDMTKWLDNQKFRFDYTFDENVTNEMVYRFTTQPLVRTVFEQGFATCFAYGQTGSGKTHTMGGDFQQGRKQNSGNGIYALAARDVFQLRNTEFRNLGLSVFCSFFEIYGAKAFDLLNNKALLRVLEDGKKEVNVVGLKEEAVDCEQDVLDIIRRGSEQRTAGTTSANNNSSRSHAVFQMIVKKGAGRTQKLWGKFSLIDLAGNERGQDTGNADRQTRTEGAEINKSLLALKECIRGMAANNNHIPFRSSKLTMVLRDSFISEKAKLCMIAMIGPGMSSCEHTLNTLRYAKRVKELGTEETCSPLEDDRMRIMDQIAKVELDTLNVQSDIDNIAKTKLGRLMSRSNQIDYDQDSFITDAMEFSNELQSLGDKYKESLQKWQDLLAKESDLTAKECDPSTKNGYTKNF